MTPSTLRALAAELGTTIDLQPTPPEYQHLATAATALNVLTVEGEVHLPVTVFTPDSVPLTRTIPFLIITNLSHPLLLGRGGF